MLTDKTKLAIDRAVAAYAKAQAARRAPYYSHEDAFKSVHEILTAHPRRFFELRERLFIETAHLDGRLRGGAVSQMMCATWLAENSLRRVN